MTELSNRPSFGDVLSSLRGGQDLSQNELARRAGMIPSGVSRIERGRQGPPKVKTIVKLCHGLGFEVADEPCQKLLQASGRLKEVISPMEDVRSEAVESLPSDSAFEARLSTLEMKLHDTINFTQQRLAEALQEIAKLRAEHRKQ